MTHQEILDRLIILAKMECGQYGPFICCNKIQQEDLFALQHALSDILIDVAHSFQTDTQELRLIEEMPYVFQDLLELSDD